MLKQMRLRRESSNYSKVRKGGWFALVADRCCPAYVPADINASYHVFKREAS